MTQGNEGPGIGGVPGISQGTTRAMTAFNQLWRVINRDAPKQLERSRRARLSMLRARR